MSTLDRRQTEAQAEWNECLDEIREQQRHVEIRVPSAVDRAIRYGDGTYSIAFGFLLGRGLSVDRAHEVALHPETVL